MSFFPKISKTMMTSLACSFFALPTVAVDAPAATAATTHAVAAPITALPQNSQQSQSSLKTASPVSIATLAVATPPSQPIQAPSSEAIGKAVVEYFKTHPEAFVEVISAVQAHAQKTQEKAQAEKIIKHGADLFNTTSGTPYLGNPTGTTEVVLFMDPFCHFCRKFEPVLFEAIKADPTLKIISRDIAIMNEKSALLIKATLAASKQGKYADMMQAVHKLAPTATEKDLVKIAKSLKLNVETFKTDLNSPDIETQLKANMDMAQNLEINGTPTFVIQKSQKIVSGYMPLEVFQQALKGPEVTQTSANITGQEISQETGRGVDAQTVAQGSAPVAPQSPVQAQATTPPSIPAGTTAQTTPDSLKG